MGKKLLSLLVSFALLLALCPAALAAEDGDVRETNFFTEQTHADVNFEDMEFQRVDTDQFLADIAALEELAGDAANTDAVKEAFYPLMDRYLDLVTMYRLANIRSSQDVMDKQAQDDFRYASSTLDTIPDALSLMMKTLLASPCGEFLKEELTEEDIEYYTSYEPMTEEQIALSEQETELQIQYGEANNQVFTTVYEGEEWDDDSIYAAYISGQVDYDTYTEISRDIAKNKNAVLGEIYMELLKVRQAYAASYGYENYAEYAYEEIYQRDFSPEEAASFHQAVKDNGFYDIYNALYMLWSFGRYDEANENILFGDYTGDIALDMMEPYVGQISSELLVAFNYMRDHHLIDSGVGENKDGSGFTTILDSYGAPFYFNTPNGNVYDFTTAVHEFGHYNNYYWQPCGWNDGSKSIDLAECHSQGLELLFAHFYPEIFGDNGQFVLDFQLMNLVSAISDGALYDELQQYVYTTEDVTLEQINQKYRQLCGEYGMVEEDDPRTEMYGWVDINHNFTAPCYYISYGVSSPVALELYLDTLEGTYTDVVDKYLEFTALPYEYSFQESLAQVSLGNPMDPAYMAELSERLWNDLDLENRLAEMEAALDEMEQQPAEAVFSDVGENNWFYGEVMLLASAGVIEGYEDGTFRPLESATWDLAMEILAGEAVGDPSDITRLEFCQMMAEVLELTSEGESPFDDVDDAAVTVMAEMGVINGYPDGTFRPDQAMTRAELCVAICRALTASLIG